MHIERTFTTLESPDSARVKIAAYLEQVGYKATGLSTVVVFQRGWDRGSVTGLPPQAANSRVDVVSSSACGRCGKRAGPRYPGP